MIMVNFDFLSQPIQFEENQINVLCIEDQKLFRKVCNSFVNNETEENNIVFSENFIPFKSKGNVYVTADYFSFPYSNTIMKKLYEQLEKYCNNEMQTETFQLKNRLINFLEILIKGFDYDFDFDYDINLVDVFKLTNLKPVTDNSDALRSLTDYILVINKYAPPKLFVLINLHLFFTENELELFYRDLDNNHINLLVIENKKTFRSSKYESVFICDKDFCEIIEKS